MLFCSMVSALPKKVHGRRQEITDQFLMMVEEHLTKLMSGEIEHRMSTKHFADLLFIAPRHLTNTVKSVLHKSPCDVMEARIKEESQALLANTTLSIAEISYKFGYQDTTNFIKFYKGMTGVTPLQYRKSLLKT
ncbi:MAG: AraC family transcriptional regulator [Pedobacter sp.]|nr:MAG: AraC family transcriptional regulator [Pedobacter sp.]